jgi:integrase
MSPPKTKKIRNVKTYLSLLEKAGRSPSTIKIYNNIFVYFARFLDVPLDDLHMHMTVENLLEYLDSDYVKKLRPNTRRLMLTVLSRYMQLNGVDFDEMELNIVKTRKSNVRYDKPLEYATLQKMMDLADTLMKAYLSFLVSTGCRAGETAQLLLSDIQETVVIIRPEIAKNGHGGKVFLTAEAREYLDLWLKERPAWIEEANKKSLNLYRPRPAQDNRLFACCYNNLLNRFQHLYDAVDGESTPTCNYDRRKITPHSCRAYFRTHAVKTMPMDLVEYLMRHTGYLTTEYVRMSDEERERAFHKGESALYITRADHRIQTGKLSELERANAELTKRLAQVEQVQQEKTTIRAVGPEYVRVEDVERLVREAVAAEIKDKT